MRLLTGAILRVPYDWVTIEWDEIAVITQGDFLADAAAAIASLAPGTRGNVESDRARLLRLSGIDSANVRFPQPKPLADVVGDRSAEGLLRSRIVGAGYSPLAG